MQRVILVCLLLLAVWPLAVYATPPEYKDGKRLELLQPDKSGGLPLMQALDKRQSNREMQNQAISQQDLSNLLWAVWGVNREDGRHTAPTAHNRQQVAVLVALDSGLWFYNSSGHELVQVMNEDIRGRLGGVPMALIYAAPGDEVTSALHVGSLYQNAGLYCASAGLANVPRITGASALSDELPLPQGYQVYIVQPVGLPR